MPLSMAVPVILEKGEFYAVSGKFSRVRCGESLSFSLVVFKTYILIICCFVSSTREILAIHSSTVIPVVTL